MAYDQQAGTGNIRATVYDSAIKQTVKRMYKFKQAVTILPTSAFNNYFFREDPTVLVAQSGNDMTDIPRGANFPQAVHASERVLSVIKQFGIEDNIPFIDLLSDEIAVEQRSIYKLSEGVTKKVDDTIWNGLTENRSPSNINSISLAAGYGWNNASAAIIDDLEQAEQKIAEYNYDTSNLMVFISPKDKRSVFKYLTDKGAQFPAISERLLEAGNNGVIGTLGNKTFIVSNSVTASYALVCVPKICATWKESMPLTVNVEDDKFKSRTIRVCEIGTLQLTDPRAVCLISGTQQ